MLRLQDLYIFRIHI